MRIAVKRSLTGQHFIKADSDTKNVRTPVEWTSSRLLRADVWKFSIGRATIGRAVPGLGDAKVDQLDLSSEAHHHVRGRNVAVNQMVLAATLVFETVGVVQRMAQLRDDVAGQRDRQELAQLIGPGQHFPEILAANVFQSNKLPGGCLSKLIDTSDVGMGELKHVPPLGNEHRDQLRMLIHPGQESLDRYHPAIAVRLHGTPYFGHSADADSIEQEVLSAADRLTVQFFQGFRGLPDAQTYRARHRTVNIAAPREAAERARLWPTSSPYPSPLLPR